MTARSCRRLGARSVMPGDAGAAAVREIPARPSHKSGRSNRLGRPEVPRTVGGAIISPPSVEAR